MSVGFCPQYRPDSCVAACCAMLLRRHSPQAEPLEATHDGLYAKFPPPLVGLRDAPLLIGAIHEHHDASDDINFAILETYVTTTWCAVEVHGGPWSHDLRFRKLTSPYGRLSNDPNSALPHHAVVLTTWGPTSIAVFDPWFDMLSQPVRVDAAWLRRAWTGELAYLTTNP